MRETQSTPAIKMLKEEDFDATNGKLFDSSLHSGAKTT
jgi:hypothetical protein